MGYEEEIKDWKRIIHDYRKEAATNFNRQLVYLSSGGLILSLGFAKDIVDLKTASDTYLLVSSWLLFVVSLLFNLFSHKSTMKAMDFELDDKEKESDQQDKKTSAIDNISIWSLVAAIVIFIVFIGLNLL